MITEFKNKENKCHTLGDGTKVWESRSVCVCIRYRVVVDKTTYHLILKRGNKVTNTGSWCFPCGYLDKGETIREAAVRELYEESGIYLTDPSELRWYDIFDKPEGNLENITVHYDCVQQMTHNQFEQWKQDVVGRHVEDHLEEGEVTEFNFITYYQLHKSNEKFNDLKFAFNHENRFITNTGNCPIDINI
jgi:8-oxo-dGTP pyrophosphatase MutT (NUDIX family)